MGRRILIASGKGGVGKTTVAAGLGIMLARLGASVVLIDADMGLSNLDTVLELDGKIVFDIADLLEKKCRIKQALIQSEICDNLYVLAGGRSVEDYELVDPIGFEEITKKLAAVFDYVIVDSPAGASTGFKVALSGVDEVIAVVTPHIVSIRDADKILGIVAAAGIKNPMFVINRIRGDLVVAKKCLSHAQIEAVMSAKLVGIIPESDEISVLSSLCFAKAMDKDIAKSFWILAGSVHKNKKALFDYTKKYRGILGFLRRKMIEKGA